MMDNGAVFVWRRVCSEGFMSGEGVLRTGSICPGMEGNEWSVWCVHFAAGSVHLSKLG